VSGTNHPTAASAYPAAIAQQEKATASVHNDNNPRRLKNRLMIPAGLARAILPDQADHRPGGHMKTHVVQGQFGPKSPSDIIYFDD
jgi:hypothetical protein